MSLLNFKTQPDVPVLLLPVHSGANGLNLIGRGGTVFLGFGIFRKKQPEILGFSHLVVMWDALAWILKVKHMEFLLF